MKRGDWIAFATVAIVLTFMFLSGCSAFHEKPLPPSEAKHIDLDVVWVESVKDMPTYMDETVQGRAVYFDIDGMRHCTIYAIKPYNLDDFKHLNTLGHELLHCTDGKFHNPVYDKNEIQERQDMMN